MGWIWAGAGTKGRKCWVQPISRTQPTKLAPLSVKDGPAPDPQGERETMPTPFWPLLLLVTWVLVLGVITLAAERTAAVLDLSPRAGSLVQAAGFVLGLAFCLRIFLFFVGVSPSFYAAIFSQP